MSNTATHNIPLSEKKFQESVFSILQNHFKIEKQVSGKHFSGKKFLIDAVIQPLDLTEWKNKEIAFGVEFKSPDKLKSTNDTTGWFAQCIDYANTNWDSYGYINIFSCPRLFDDLTFANVQDSRLLINRLFSNLGIGELYKHKNYGFCFYLQNSHLIWSEKRGVIGGKNWSLKRKFGSR